MSSAAEPEIDRYDLGQRLIRLERAWAADPDAAARARALPVLKLAVPQLLAGKMAEAAATLDRSRLLLESAAPTPAETWAAALLVHPARRFLDVHDGPLVGRIIAGYDAGPPAADATVWLTLASAKSTGKTTVTVPLAKLPAEFALPIDNRISGDCTLRAEVRVGERVIGIHEVGVSVTFGLDHRLDSLAQVPNGGTVDGATLTSLRALLRSLARGRSPESNYPADRLLDEAESLSLAVKAGRPFYHPARPGQFWLSIPSGSGITPVRVLVPQRLVTDKRLPLVVALHGAGGSENLFFDAYGFGLIARLAQERGWMVVAPRAGWLFNDPPPVPAIVDELAKVYPVDRQRVYLVGHSMGAMQAITLAQEAPGRYAAVAVLGGGGTVTKPEAFKNVPVFIGCGHEDFMLGGAKGLAKTLEKARAARVTITEYSGVEHMLIVQEALPDVFRFFEKAKSDASEKRPETASPTHR